MPGLNRGTPLRPGKGPRRYTPLRAGRQTRTRPQPAVPDTVRQALVGRSGGWCEPALPGCQGRGHDASHRITTKAGGRHGAAKELHDRLSDVTYSCRPCHRWITDKPALAGLLGLALREWQDSAAWPVLLLRYDDSPVFLSDAGGVTRFEEGP
jgi:hypothetical protein